jgi:phospholipid/cholesterol/gamma-HCH transport system substrate-binding protein
MTRKHVLSIISIIATFALCLLYLFGVALKTPLTKPRVNVAVLLPLSGGIYEGSEVTYRGLRVGRVSALDLTDDGVRATVRLDAAARIPVDARPKVRSLSPVGEQYIDFQPRTGQGPYLADGSVVRGTAADIPTSLATAAINLDNLIQQIDPDALRTVLTETAAGLEGSEDDLQQLVVQGVELLNEFNAHWEATERVIVNGGTLLTLGADLVPEFNSITSDAKTFANWLRDVDPVLARLLEKSPGQIEELRRLVRDVDGIMTAYLDPYITLADFIVAREPHLRALAESYPRGFLGLMSGIHGGSVHLNAFFEHYEHCPYGAVEREALDITRHQLQEGGVCPKDPTLHQRGAQWAPGPLR